MKTKTLVMLLMIVLLLSACSKKPTISAEAQFREAIDIEELSTAEFVHNGITQIQQGKKTYNISYHARVKVGVNMSDISFDVDHESKTVDIYLPEIVVNQVDVDPSEIRFIPSGPDFNLPEVLTACESDVLDETNSNEKVREAGKTEFTFRDIKRTLHQFLMSKAESDKP